MYGSFWEAIWFVMKTVMRSSDQTAWKAAGPSSTGSTTPKSWEKGADAYFFVGPWLGQNLVSPKYTLVFLTQNTHRPIRE